MSPSIIGVSNLIYLNTPLTSWLHLIESVFRSFNMESNSNYKKLKEEFVDKLTLIKQELDSNANNYNDVVPVMFEPKVRLSLSILRVKFIIRRYF